MFNSRGCSIQEGVLYSYLILKPFFYASFWRQLWDIYPETQKPVELEEIPDIDEFENN